MKPSKPTTKPYTRRSASYKDEALKLADRIGYAEAARQLTTVTAYTVPWAISARWTLKHNSSQVEVFGFNGLDQFLTYLTSSPP